MMTATTAAIAGKFSCYQFIFQQQYDFQVAARTLESVLQRLKEFIFMLYSNPADNSVIPVMLIEENARELRDLIPYHSSATRSGILSHQA